MSTPKTGDRVKVEYEGVVQSANKTGRRLVNIQREDGRVIAISPQFVTVIEPEYETNTMYVDRHGIFYLRGDGFWIFAATGQHYDHDRPHRPLRKLVPEPTFIEVAARL